ncbi:hypothetical protein FGO68_gene4320 [Halteria grandinella]|uniref:Uncharacterized protein n=1 Tax=Halteria grandinella TaxID=5974 RepID=A0A8J8SUA1_HALGN|nr:hypothetical protein FGO68_gene4320 [Halteria grandinella]
MGLLYLCLTCLKGRFRPMKYKDYEIEIYPIHRYNLQIIFNAYSEQYGWSVAQLDQENTQALHRTWQMFFPKRGRINKQKCATKSQIAVTVLPLHVHQKNESKSKCDGLFIHTSNIYLVSLSLYVCWHMC